MYCNAYSSSPRSERGWPRSWSADALGINLVTSAYEFNKQNEEWCMHYDEFMTSLLRPKAE